MNEHFLKSYINSYSPSGSEMESQQLWINQISNSVTDIKIEDYGNVIARINKDNAPSILIESHVDEVSYRVNIMTENGLIYVIKNGNADHQIAPSSRVKIHTERGLVDGVFGWPAIHTRETSKEVSPTIENIFIDCGVDSKKELEKMGIKVGCLVTYPSNFQILGNYYTGKGLDDKIGGYIMSQVIDKLKGGKIESKYDLLFANTVQEEVGLRGSSMICKTYKPKLAIVIDVTSDSSTPMMNKKKSGDVACGKGPIIVFSPVTHSKFVDYIEKTAIKNKINYQRKALGRTTGTNADNYVNYGIMTALISVPLRYMHTKVEMVHSRDVENTINLIYNILKNLDVDYDFSFLKK